MNVVLGVMLVLALGAGAFAVMTIMKDSKKNSKKKARR